MRVVSPRFVRNHKRINPAELIPLAFSLGSAPEWQEPYSGLAVKGHFVPVEGYRVVSSCAETRRSNTQLNHGKPPSHTVAELMLVISSSEKGSIVESFDVQYSVGSDNFTLPVNWSLTSCGTEIDSGC